MEKESQNENIAEVNPIQGSSDNEAYECILKILVTNLENVIPITLQGGKRKSVSHTPSGSKRNRSNSGEHSGTPATNSNVPNAPMITEENLEDVQIELNNFNLRPALSRQINNGKVILPTNIPIVLEGYLQFVAKGGWTFFAWQQVKWLFKVKMNIVVGEFQVTSPNDPLSTVSNVQPFHSPDRMEMFFEKLESFNGVPFTVQRIAELLTSPKQHYKQTEKFMTALEKCLLVISTTDVKPLPPTPTKDPEPATAIEKIILMAMSNAQTEEKNSNSASHGTETTSSAEVTDDLIVDIKLPSGGKDVHDKENENPEAMEIDPECSSDSNTPTTSNN